VGVGCGESGEMLVEVMCARERSGLDGKGAGTRSGAASRRQVEALRRRARRLRCEYRGRGGAAQVVAEPRSHPARESPAISIANHFLSEKALINVYDPQVEESQIWLDLTE
jgi:hypothetical protein